MSKAWEAVTPGRGQSRRVFTLMFAALLSCAFWLAAQSAKPGGAANSTEEFFVISSVEIAKRQLLLKRPTEITELLQVNDKTRYTDKNGKAIQFADLRAGDTVYIRSTATPAGKLAVSVRRGPMTLEELHRHYLK
jgi:hypothetical protein